MNKKEKALLYAQAGFKIFPLWWILENGKCACGDPTCGDQGSFNNPGKHPITGKPGNWIARNGRLDSTANIETVQRWWSAYPEANIALDCAGNGLLVVDVDRHTDRKGVETNGFEAIDDFETTFKDKIESNVSAETGGGGLHIFFKAPQDFTSCPGGLGKNYPGVDFKFNGYVLLDSSNHKSGKIYSFTEGSEADFLARKFPPLPRSIEKLIRDGFDDNRYSPARYTASSRDLDSDDIDQIKEALSCIPFTGISDDERLKVGMGLQQILPGGMGKQLYFDWIAGSVSKFDRKQTERRWRSFKFRSGGRTIASFYELAMEYGFENTGKQGVYVDPSDHIIMEPDLVSEAFDDAVNVLFVCDDVPLPMHIDEWMLPPIMEVDFEAKPSVKEPDLPAFGSFGNPVKQQYISRHETEERAKGMEFMRSRNSVSMRMLTNAMNAGDLPPGYGMPKEEELQEWFAYFGNRKVLCDLFRWQVENSSSYVPEVSCAFTVSVMGALLAGRFEHKSLTTNLYYMVIADSTVGKSQTVRLAKKVFEAAFDKDRIGPKDIVSDKGFINDMVRDKGRYFLLDEIGELFANVFSDKANISQKMIRRVILDGYTSFGETTNVTASKADMKSNQVQDIGGICPSIFGLTTPGKIYEAFTGGDIVDGMLSRFQVLVSKSGVEEGKVSANSPLPASVGNWIHQIRGIFAPGMHVHGSDTCTQMSMSDDAYALQLRIKKVETERKRGAEKYSGIWGRLTENTIRVAMVFELTERPFATVIQFDSLILAYEFVSYCTEKCESLARNHISDSKEHSLMVEVLNYIKTKKKGARLQDITENTKIGADVRNRRLIIQALKSEQKIREFEFRASEGQRGRGTLVYFTYDTYNEFIETRDGEKFQKCSKEK